MNFSSQMDRSPTVAALIGGNFYFYGDTVC
jgi:hypothetical protein